MRILTKEIAESVTKYYSEIVIGKPITNPGNTNPFLISSLEMIKVEDGYTVYCFCKHYGKIIHNRLDKVIPELDALPLEDFLSNLNQ